MPLFLCSDQVTDVLLSDLTLQQNQKNGPFKVSLTQCISLVNVYYVCVFFFFFTGKEVFSSPSKGIMFDMLQSPFCLCVCKIQTDYRDKQSVCFQKIDFPFFRYNERPQSYV